MSRLHSFTITLSNNITEKAGILYLLENHIGFFQPTRESKKVILSLLEQEHRFLQAFDLVYIPRLASKNLSDNIINTNIEELILVELKTTMKFLPQNPKGFFFGATENEFEFARRLGDKFRFCFVSLNENSKSFSLLTLEELESIIRNKRIQYQINL